MMKMHQNDVSAHYYKAFDADKWHFGAKKELKNDEDASNLMYLHFFKDDGGNGKFVAHVPRARKQ